MPQLGAQDGPGAAQEAPKMRQEPPKSCPRGVQEAAYRRLRAKARHKAAPDSLKTSILNHFGDDLEGFGTIWDGFLEGFWKDFKTNWIHIGTHPDLLYLEDAWWRERGFAALKIYILRVKYNSKNII